MNRSLLFAVFSFLLITLGCALADFDMPKKVVPELDGQPVFLTYGMVVVHPKGLEEPPEGYEGAMRGAGPLAIMKIDGTVVGEVYGNPLRGKAEDEADEMRGSADKSPLIDLLKRASAERTDLAHEIATLLMNTPSKLGNPWIVHSLYFPRGDHSVTFKFVAGRKDFERVLPLFEAMLFTQEFMNTPDRAEPESQKQEVEADTDRSATRSSDSKSGDDEKPQPDAEGRSR